MPNLPDLSPWTCLEYLDLTDTQLTRLPKFPQTLKHLILNDNLHLHVAAEQEDPTGLPLLETFGCSATNIDARILKAITSESIKAGNLKRLYVGGRLAEFRPQVPVADEYPPSDTVEELSLSSMIIGDQRAIQVASLYPRLTRLDMSATKVSGVAVRQFVDMGIKWLRLNECDCVSFDAVEWARGKGVDVAFSLASSDGNLRNVRFRDAFMF